MKKIVFKVKGLNVVPFQKCPVCGGTGTVFNNQIIGTTNATSGWVTCDVCHGMKIIPMYVPPKEEK